MLNQLANQISRLERALYRTTPDTGHDLPIFARGRLTLTSGIPVLTANVIGAATLYFTPYLGCYDFSEVPFALGPLAANTNHDIFLENLSVLSATAWATATARATTLTRYQGYLSLTGDSAKRYVGSIRIGATKGQTDMILEGGNGTVVATPARLFVWNHYNRIFQRAKVSEAGAWGYGPGGFRQMNNSANNQLEFIIGLSEDAVQAMGKVQAAITDTENINVSIGLDVVNAAAVDSQQNAFLFTGITGATLSMSSFYNGYPGIGYHFLAPIEAAGAGSGLWYGGATQSFHGIIHG